MKSIEIIVEAHHSDGDRCVCCEGNHRFATTLRTKDGKPYAFGDLTRSVAEKLPNGSVIKVTVETIQVGD